MRKRKTMVLYLIAVLFRTKSKLLDSVHNEKPSPKALQEPTEACTVEDVKGTNPGVSLFFRAIYCVFRADGIYYNHQHERRWLYGWLYHKY